MLNADNALLTTKQVLDKLQISRSTLSNWRNNGNFPAPIKISARSIRWLEKSIDNWLDQENKMRPIVMDGYECQNCSELFYADKVNHDIHWYECNKSGLEFTPADNFVQCEYCEAAENNAECSVDHKGIGCPDCKLGELYECDIVEFNGDLFNAKDFKSLGIRIGDK